MLQRKDEGSLGVWELGCGMMGEVGRFKRRCLGTSPPAVGSYKKNHHEREGGFVRQTLRRPCSLGEAGGEVVS